MRLGDPKRLMAISEILDCVEIQEKTPTLLA